MHLHETRLSMSAAEKVCRSQGGHPASLGSKDEQNRLEKQMQQMGGLMPTIWLGLSEEEGQQGWMGMVERSAIKLPILEF